MSVLFDFNMVDKKNTAQQQFHCYDACMNSLKIIPFVFALLFAGTLQASEDAVPPPEMDSSEPIMDQPESEDEAPSLNDALTPSKDAIDVRSYQDRDGATVTEYGKRGHIFKIKVQPSGSMPAYYLYPDGHGHFARRLPGGAKGITPPSWILKEF
ncbi:MAG: DUF2782 domain-containing protein [Mariprofundus sp.]|nr:DUF2782 domain-containing protein [Mariprofundus sp.]